MVDKVSRLRPKSEDEIRSEIHVKKIFEDSSSVGLYTGYGARTLRKIKYSSIIQNDVIVLHGEKTNPINIFVCMCIRTV